MKSSYQFFTIHYFLNTTILNYNVYKQFINTDDDDTKINLKKTLENILLVGITKGKVCRDMATSNTSNKQSTPDLKMYPYTVNAIAQRLLNFRHQMTLNN